MITTTELIRQVRSQIQETNESGPVDDPVIIDALNRGLDYGWDILARNYNPPILATTDPDNLLVVDTDGKVELPDGIFEDRLLKVDLHIGGAVYELTALSHKDVTNLSQKQLGSVPTAYTLMGRSIQLWPRGAAAGNKIALWYLRNVPKIVKQEGRVTAFTSGGGVSNAVVVVDSLTATSLSVSGAYNKYLNFVNFETGELRGSAQIQSINGTEITLKLTPTRTRVLDRTIENDVPADLEVDDFICGIQGSCVMYFSKPLSNMIIQYAVAEIRRSLGYDIGIEERKLKDLENQVNYTFSKRPNILRVKRRSKLWRSRFNSDNGGS